MFSVIDVPLSFSGVVPEFLRGLWAFAATRNLESCSLEYNMNDIRLCPQVWGIACFDTESQNFGISDARSNPQERECPLRGSHVFDTKRDSHSGREWQQEKRHKVQI